MGYSRAMTANGRTSRATLRRIAHRAMLERGLEPDFSPAVLAELKRIPPKPAPPAAGRDLRHLTWCSIDNDDSLDLDQLTVAQALPGGAVQAAGGHRGRGRPGGQGLGGRRPRADEHDLGLHGGRDLPHAARAAVHRPHLARRPAGPPGGRGRDDDRRGRLPGRRRPLPGPGPQPRQARLQRRRGLAGGRAGRCRRRSPRSPASRTTCGSRTRSRRSCRTLRHEHGALDLRPIEARAVFDADQIQDLADEEKNRAKELIEDFMIAANGVTARFLEDKGFPSLRRVVRTPKRWERIVELAARARRAAPRHARRAFARALPGQAPGRRPAPLPRPVAGRGQAARARASTSSSVPGGAAPGHFGLAVKDYTHSTAPNRRFPDLITQRLLKAALAGAPPPYAADELAALATHCTAQEDAANKVERQVAKSAAALLLSSHVGERFDAIVTGAAAKGTWVRIFRPPVEGKVVEGASRPRRRRPRPGAARPHRRRARLHRLPAGERPRPRLTRSV